MKPYFFNLTDSAHNNPGSFLPLIERTLVAQGCLNFKWHRHVGCITGDFPGVMQFGPIPGLISAEEDLVGVNDETPAEIRYKNVLTAGLK